MLSTSEGSRRRIRQRVGVVVQVVGDLQPLLRQTQQLLVTSELLALSSREAVAIFALFLLLFGDLPPEQLELLVFSLG